MNEKAIEAADLPQQRTKTTFAEAREMYLSSVFAYVSRRVKPATEAEDITAQVFVEAFKHWSKLRGEPKLWLLGIARRKVADSLRKRRWWNLRETDLTVDAMTAFEDAAEAHAATAIVLQLPPDERDAFLMQVLEEMPIAEIAVVMGRSRAATNSLLQRSRARIKKLTSEVENGN